MSFILDALRKSESERQRESAPTPTRSPYARARRRSPGWNWLIIGLLSVAVIVLGAVALFDGDAPIAAGQADRPSATNAEREPLRVPEPSRPATAPITVPVPAQAQDITQITTAPAASNTPAAGASAESDGRILNMADLLDRNPAMPEPLLEIVAFDPENPARSSAWINGLRLYVGESLGHGVTLAEVMQSGVLLSFQGERFLLRI